MSTKDVRHRSPLPRASEPAHVDKSSATNTSSAADSAASKKHRPWNPVDIRPSTSLHTKEQPSLLSMEAPPQNYRGFLNLLVIALVVMNIRLVIENLLKYGILVRFRTTIFQKWDQSWPSFLTVVIISTLNPFLGFLVEKYAALGKLSVKAAQCLHTVNIVAVFFIPLYVIYYSNSTLESGYILAFACLILTMKLISYAHVSHDIRSLSSKVIVFGDGYECAYDPAVPPASMRDTRIGDHSGEHATAASKASDLVNAQSSDSAALPSRTSAATECALESLNKGKSTAATAAPTSTTTSSNSSSSSSSSAANDEANAKSFKVVPYTPRVGQLFYFLAAPTLVYQLSYPRTTHVRKWFVARRLMEIIFIGIINVFIVEQYVMPTLQNSLVHFDNLNIIPIVERVLKLCVPNTIVWLLIFYALFHSYLNLVAELLRFGDRVFYRDWWNSGDLAIYWRLWNRPVHDWLVRHAYCVAVRAGYSPNAAKVFVFFISAALHEVLVSVPCHVVSFHAFFAMFLQVPVIAVTQWVHRKSRNPVFGNVTFWFALCVFGQPLLILLYGYQYMRMQ